MTPSVSDFPPIDMEVTPLGGNHSHMTILNIDAATTKQMGDDEASFSKFEEFQRGEA